MRLRDETGFTLPEMLVAMIMFAIILLATLSVFDTSTKVSAANTQQNDAVEESRVAVDQVARQLRNLASPTTPLSTIDTAAPYNLIFQTDDPNKTWVRYCLVMNGSGPKAKGNLYYASSAASTLTAAQTNSTCPGTGWDSVKVVAQDVTNRTNGQDRPVFTYSCTDGSPSGCPASSADNSRIVLAREDLFIDTNPGFAPAERRVATGVYLRNQNQQPTASFTWANQPAFKHTVILNGSASADPEGRTLHFYWCEGSTSTCTPTSSYYIGTGVTLTYTFPSTDASGSTPTIALSVFDPGGLSATTSTPANGAVTVPTP
ncbi:MAG TPA: prepilin-type N-terminal cleavage/methylation domain-containing protein [Thermoleophilaceae bacterium]